MISSSEAEEGVVKHLVSGAKKLGYKPFNNITYISENANGLQFDLPLFHNY